MSNWKECRSQSPEPVTRAKMASRFSSGRATRQSFGTRCWIKEASLESNRAALARATRCVWKCVIRSKVRNPIEAGLGFFVDLAKPKFTGREVLLKAKEHGTTQKLAAFRMDGKGPPPRPHYPVFNNGNRIGEVTSGTLSPSLNYGIGMAYIDAPHAKIATKIEIEIRGQKFPAIIEKKPLYKKDKIPLPPETAAATTPS